MPEVDYPRPLPTVNQTASVPRRIRAMLNRKIVADTTSALYVWEWNRYPQYYIPIRDVDPTVLVDEHHEQRLSRGTARRYGLAVGAVSRPAALTGLRRGRRPRPGRLRPLRMGGHRRVVRGRRASLRPSPRSLHQGGRPALHPPRPGRTRWHGSSRVRFAGPGVRDRSTHPLLPQPQRGRLHPPRSHRHRHRPARTKGPPAAIGPPRSAATATPTSRGPTTSRPASSSPSPVWSPSTTKRSISSSTAAGSDGPSHTSPERPTPSPVRTGSRRNTLGKTVAGRDANTPRRQRRPSVTV